MSDEMMTLKATTRESGTKGAARRVRAGGQIPSVVYGNGIDNLAIAVDPKELELCLRSEYGFNAVFHLDCEGAETYTVMVKDYQFHGVRREITHVDFIVVTGDDTVTIQVPIETTGKAKGVVMGGRLDVVARAVKLRCTVKDIPAAVIHDITRLRIGDAVYIDEIDPPEGCEFVYDHRFPVIRIARKRGPLVAEGEEGAETDEALEAGEEGEGEEGADEDAEMADA